MALNIKNEHTQQLVQDLMNVTGESMTAAVTEAVRERLDRIRDEQGDGLAERLLEIGKDCAAHLKKQYRTIDHADLLFKGDDFRHTDISSAAR